jgi:hypothetical protein
LYIYKASDKPFASDMASLLLYAILMSYFIPRAIKSYRSMTHQKHNGV